MYESNTTVNTTIDYLKSSLWIHVFSGSWLCLVFLSSIILNGLTLAVFFKRRALINNGSFLIVAILINGTLRTLCGYVMQIIAEFSGHFFTYLTNDACTAQAFIVYFFGISSIFLHVAIALQRYLAAHRMSYNKTMTMEHLGIALLVCEGLALIIAICPLAGFGSYGLEAHGTSCGLAWNDRRSRGIGYLGFIFVVCYVLPLFIIIFCYARIIHTVRKTRRAVQPTVDVTSAERLRKEAHLVRLSIALVVVFLLCWTPYAIISFYVAFARLDAISPIVTRTASWLAKLETVLNPIVYLIMSRRFRSHIRSCFVCADSADVNTQLTTFSALSQSNRIASDPFGAQSQGNRIASVGLFGTESSNNRITSDPFGAQSQGNRIASIGQFDTQTQNNWIASDPFGTQSPAYRIASGQVGAQSQGNRIASGPFSAQSQGNRIASVDLFGAQFPGNRIASVDQFGTHSQNNRIDRITSVGPFDTLSQGKRVGSAGQFGIPFQGNRVASMGQFGTPAQNNWIAAVGPFVTVAQNNRLQRMLRELVIE